MKDKLFKHKKYRTTKYYVKKAGIKIKDLKKDIESQKPNNNK